MVSIGLDDGAVAVVVSFVVVVLGGVIIGVPFIKKRVRSLDAGKQAFASIIVQSTGNIHATSIQPHPEAAAITSFTTRKTQAKRLILSLFFDFVSGLLNFFTRFFNRLIDLFSSPFGRPLLPLAGDEDIEQANGTKQYQNTFDQQHWLFPFKDFAPVFPRSISIFVTPALLHSHDISGTAVSRD
jgi:hypothetical protein